MPALNHSVCSTCSKRVPAEHVVRDGQVFIHKNCPDCGPTEALISTNAARWQQKRDLCKFDPDAPIVCTLHCDRCSRIHAPKVVFVDVTNRCNMNCPICISNIPGMGFTFDPPLAYFEGLLAAVGKMVPKPVIQLFGGEPTVREDLFDIIAIAQRHGLNVRVVTNGLRLADEDYCRRMCEMKVQIFIAFDGRDPEIYERMRHNRAAYFTKLKALENIRKFNIYRNTLMVCVARKINDHLMRDLINYCHESRPTFKSISCIPLTETWEKGEFKMEAVTTTEDVEAIFAEAFPECPLEFIPAGLTNRLDRLAEFFKARIQKLGGVHPNCESITYLIADEKQYWPVGHFLRRPTSQVVDDVLARTDRLAPLLNRLDPKRGWQRFRGRMAILRRLGWFGLRQLNFKHVLKGNRFLTSLRFLGGMLIGRRLKRLVRKHTNLQETMAIVILPFEEYHSVESARMQDCFTAFAYEDPDTGEVKTVPVCVWRLYQRDVERRIAAKYQGAAVPAPAPTPVTQ